FQARIDEVAAKAREPQPIAIERAGEGLAVDGLTLALPNGRVLREGVAADAGPGSALLVTGPSGAGKSTLLRAVAGIWPFGRGHVRLGTGRAFFLPQKPYIPLGTLRGALLYPDEGKEVPAERLREVLSEVGLGHLAPNLDEADNWAQRLSGGEQQRLA